ncbi:transketolase family protein [Saccharopolyspora halophila]|uniref:Transketolase family protein n=1 Tax=Saccharopolyspora halophila TaxID=405551 RepID=A0ABN3GHM0_9PSEU
MSTHTSTATAVPKRLTSDAMSASLAREDQRVTAAPLGHALVGLAREDDRIVGLSADLAKYTDLHIFRDAMPERFYQIGMAEQALVGAAAGLAMEGFVPFVSTYSVFATRRAYDFLCLDVVEAGLNVNMVCALPGLTTGYGPSHQATEDVAILRGMPELTIVDPCDAVDIEQAVPQLAAHDGPTYTRILRGKVPRVLDEYDYSFELGKAKLVRDGADVLLVSTGLMTERALEAARELDADRIDVAVLHVPTLKPLDEETILRELGKDRLVLTCENHTVIGGLFDAVAHTAVRDGIGRQVTPVGLPDEFLDAGALPTLSDRYGVSTNKLVERIRAMHGAAHR